MKPRRGTREHEKIASSWIFVPFMAHQKSLSVFKSFTLDLIGNKAPRRPASIAPCAPPQHHRLTLRHSAPFTARTAQRYYHAACGRTPLWHNSTVTIVVEHPY